jgi:hypothetical protein
MRPMLLIAAAALVACRSEPTASPVDFNLSGSWRQSGDFRDLTTGFSHIHLGRFEWSQTGDRFAGTGQQDGLCSTAAGAESRGPLSDGVPFAVSDGQVQDLGVQFHAGVCEYQGVFENGNPNRLTGSAICRYEQDGVSYTLQGRWQADRPER